MLCKILDTFVSYSFETHLSQTFMEAGSRPRFMFADRMNALFLSTRENETVSYAEFLIMLSFDDLLTETINREI